MFGKNIKIILILLVIILFIVVGIYAFTNKNIEINDVNENNLSSNENNIINKVDDEDALLNKKDIEISSEEQSAVNNYLENNITELSPKEAVLGGTFYVSTVSFPTENTAIVNYEDGHIALRAKIDYSYNNKSVEINSFELISDSNTYKPNSKNDPDICIDMCGDEVCQEIVCMGEGCPCPETTQSCPTDCS